jgi:hypothetical protein
MESVPPDRYVLRDAKRIALESLTHEFLFHPFKTYLTSKMRIEESLLLCDLEGARRRVREAVLLSRSESEERRDEICGETDGEVIWITRGLSLSECVDTLLHEAMHDSVFVVRETRSGKRKNLPCDVEHEIIYSVLGPPYEEE